MPLPWFWERGQGLAHLPLPQHEAEEVDDNSSELEGNRLEGVSRGGGDFLYLPRGDFLCLPWGRGGGSRATLRQESPEDLGFQRVSLSQHWESSPVILAEASDPLGRGDGAQRFLAVCP